VFPSINGTPPGGSTPAQQQASANAGDDSALDPTPRKIRTLAIHTDQPVVAPVTQRPPAAAPTAVRTIPVQAASTSSRSNGPLSITPNGGPAAVGGERTASAAVGPTPAPATVTRTTGGYLVQIASQKTEAEAEASYRAAQGKFSNLLGSMTSIIKRADLGDKGVYYRAMVGPFSTSEEAGKLCSNLRIAGGSCVVQRN
jgi:cell division protein FtsN